MFGLRLLPATAVLAALFSTPHAPAQQTPKPDNANPTAATKPDWTEIPLQPEETPRVPTFPEIKIPNFTSCPIADLQRLVPDLAHLEEDNNRPQLSSLLESIGSKTVSVANRMPDLISRERVITEQGNTKDLRDFSFLILQRPLGKDARILDEYRVDVATGEKIQTEFREKALQGAESPSQLNIPEARALPGTAGPQSRGFVSAWLYLYPSNQDQLEFRYLGIQQVDRHPTLVLAFAQKPALVQIPTSFEFEDRNYPIFMQGLVWVDPSNFEILHERLDLLSAPRAVPLRQFTVDIQFSEISIAELPSMLRLPTRVVVTTDLAGSVTRETHTYSNFRLFRTHSKIVAK